MSNIRIKRGNKSQDVNHNLLNVDTLNINVSITSDAKVKGHKSALNIVYWKTENVVNWFRKNCSQYFSLYGELFREHEITGSVLIHLNDAKLTLLGIQDSHHREAILQQILRLKLSHDSFDLEELLNKTDTKKEET